MMIIRTTYSGADAYTTHSFSLTSPSCLVVRPQSLFPSSKSVGSCSAVPLSSRARCNLGDDYKLLHCLGEGAYGTVVAALHKPSGRQVAIKKVLPFEHTLFCLRTLRELKLLRFFSDTCANENVACVSCVSPPIPLVDEPMSRLFPS